MEDKILERLTKQLEEQIREISKVELKESNKILTKAKKTSEEVISKMNAEYKARTEELEKESKKVAWLEERVAELESMLSGYKKTFDKLKTISNNAKFIKKYLK